MTKEEFKKLPGGERVTLLYKTDTEEIVEAYRCVNKVAYRRFGYPSFYVHPREFFRQATKEDLEKEFLF